MGHRSEHPPFRGVSTGSSTEGGQRWERRGPKVKRKDEEGERKDRA